MLIWRFVELTAGRLSQTEGASTILCSAYPHSFFGADPSEKSWRRQKETTDTMQVIRRMKSCCKIGIKPNSYCERIRVGIKLTKVLMFSLGSIKIYDIHFFLDNSL